MESQRVGYDWATFTLTKYSRLGNIMDNGMCKIPGRRPSGFWIWGCCSAAPYRPQVTLHFEELPCQKPSTFFFGLIQKDSTSVIQFTCSVVSESLRPMDCSIPSFLVHQKILALSQTRVHSVSDANQPSHPPSSPSPPAFNLSQHQGLFKWVSSSQQVTKVYKIICNK